MGQPGAAAPPVPAASTVRTEDGHTLAVAEPLIPEPVTDEQIAQARAAVDDAEHRVESARDRLRDKERARNALTREQAQLAERLEQERFSAGREDRPPAPWLEAQTLNYWKMNADVDALATDLRGRKQAVQDALNALNQERLEHGRELLAECDRAADEIRAREERLRREREQLDAQAKDVRAAYETALRAMPTYESTTFPRDLDPLELTPVRRPDRWDVPDVRLLQMRPEPHGPAWLVEQHARMHEAAERDREPRHPMVRTAAEFTGEPQLLDVWFGGHA